MFPSHYIFFLFLFSHPVSDELPISQTDCNVVDGIDLDEIKEFAKAFKLRRLSLGLTQTQVGQALSVTEGPAYSQSAICRWVHTISIKFVHLFLLLLLYITIQRLISVLYLYYDEDSLCLSISFFLPLFEFCEFNYIFVRFLGITRQYSYHFFSQRFLSVKINTKFIPWYPWNITTWYRWTITISYCPFDFFIHIWKF